MQSQQDATNFTKYTLHQMLTKGKKGYKFYIIMGLVYFTGPTRQYKDDATFQKRQRTRSYTIHKQTLQLENCDMNFDLNTWCQLIINNRHMQVIKPTTE